MTMRAGNRTLYKLIAMLLLLVTGFFVFNRKTRVTPAEQAVYRELAPVLTQQRDYYSFRPAGEIVGGVIIFPDQNEDPKSYAPMARILADQGLEIRVVKYPIGLIGLSNADRSALEDGSTLPWVSLGFGKGSEKACSLADKSARVAGLILVGSCDSRINLNDNDVQVTIYQLKDQLPNEKNIAELHGRMPADTQYITVDTKEEIMAEIPGNNPEIERLTHFESLVGEVRRVLWNKVVNSRNKK